MSDATSKAKQGGKSLIGYVVQDYSGTLGALEADLSSAGSTQTVMGTDNDLSHVDGAAYDATTGICTDTDTPIWRMQLFFHGAIPVQNTENNGYDIAAFTVDKERKTENPYVSATQLCPLYMNTETINHSTVEDYKVGASVNFNGNAQSYFQKFYCGGSANVKDFNFAKLIENNCLRAQIVFPKSNTSQIVGIIGQTPVKGKNAACYLTTPILGADGWDKSGITLTCKDGTKSDNEILPNPSKYKFPLQGASYQASKNVMVGLTKTALTEYSNTPASGFAGHAVLQLNKPSVEFCYVKLYIEAGMKDVAAPYVPKDVNKSIYETYKGKVVSRTVVTGNYTGPIRNTMQYWCDKWSTVQFGPFNGAITYDTNLRPSSFVKGKGGAFTNSTESFNVTYGHNRGISVFDCSSFAILFLYNVEGIIDTSKTTLQSFNTDSLSTLAKYLNNGVLNPKYKAIQMAVTESTQVFAGDLLWITKGERTDGASMGHAAIAYPTNQGFKTIDIGGTYKGKMRNLARKNKPKSYYKHLVRIVQAENNG